MSIDKDIDILNIKFNEILTQIEFVKTLPSANNHIHRSFLNDKKRILSEIDMITSCLKNHVIPKSFPKELLCSCILRDFVTKYMGYALICEDWVKELAKWIGDKHCLEIMGGKGVLSKALLDMGVIISCTDDYSWGDFNFNDTWCDVEKIDCIKAIENKSYDIVIVCWPYMDNTAYKCLQKIRKTNENALIIYIGDIITEKTADKSFHNSMEIIDDDNINKINSLYPSWDGINDRIYLIK